MKRYNIIISLLLSAACFVHLPANTVTASTPRLWDNASENLSQSDVILALSCSVEASLQDSFDGTFTLFDDIEQSICTIESQTDSLNTTIIATKIFIETITSKTDILYEDVTTVLSVIDQMRVDDFGGTWTALEGLNGTFDSKFDLVDISVASIDSSVNQIAATQETHFVATFTALQVVSSDVLDTLVELSSLSDQLIDGLSQIDTCILTANSILLTADSKLDIADARVVEFDGTYSTIEGLTEQLCTMESKLEIIESLLVESQVDTFTTLNEIVDKTCTIESLIDLADVRVTAIDSVTDKILNVIDTDYSKVSVIDIVVSEIDLAIQTLNSKVDFSEQKEISIDSIIDLFDMSVMSVLDKACTISSKIDELDPALTTVVSKVDILVSELTTIHSNIDLVSFISLESKVDFLDSQIDVILPLVDTISSKVDVIDTARITIASKIDGFDTSITVEISKICTIDSKIDNITSNIDVLEGSFTSIISSVNTISSKVEIIDQNVDEIFATLQTIDSKVDILDMAVDTLDSKVCLLDDQVYTVGSKIDVLSTIASNVDVVSETLLEDMQETWTILDSITNVLCTVLVKEETISSKLDVVMPMVDFTYVYTAIAAIDNKTEPILAQSISLESRIDLYNSECITDLSTTLTALDGALESVCSAESAVDIFVNDLELIINYGGVAVTVPIEGSFSATYSITSPGVYSVQNDIDFAPNGSPNAICIDANDVHLDLCGKTIRQTNSASGVSAIVVSSGKSNISIANGAIRDFTGNGIDFEGNNCMIRIDNMRLIDNESDQIIINSSLTDEGASNIYLRDISINGGNADCIQFNNSAGIFIANCIANDAGAHGIHVQACDYLVMEQCSMNNNFGCGFAITATDNSNQQFGATNFVIDTCNMLTNTTTGGCFRGFNKNGVVIDCITESNTDGLRFDLANNQELNSTKNVLLNNVSSHNTRYGIYVADKTKDNFFGFNKMYQNNTVNYQEDVDGGPNSLLGNFSFHTTDESAYEPGLTMVNSSTISNTAAFTDEPTFWINIVMTP